MTTLIRNELLKLRTTRTPWLLLAAAQLIVILGVAGILLNDGSGVPAPAAVATAVAHSGLVSLFALMVGITAVAGEYRHKTISDTYLTTPRRIQVVAAKLITYTALGIGYGAAAATTALVTSAICVAVLGGSPCLGYPYLWRTVIGGIVWNAAFAAIGVGLGALIRNLTVAVAVALMWLVIIEEVIAQIIGTSLGRWLPFTAGESLGRLPAFVNAMPQWGAALLLIGYAVLFAVLAAWTSVRRDVT